MSRRGHKPCHSARGPLQLLSQYLLITITCALATEDATLFVIDDAGGASDFSTAPVIGSTVPQGSSDPNIPRWATQGCVGCPNRPILENPNGQTYTAVYIPPEVPYTYDISFQFNGSANEVYFVLSNQAPTNCNFELDGISTSYTGNTMEEFQYRTLAFSKGDLDLRMHKMSIRVEGLLYTANYVNFDYAQFTHLSPTNTTDGSTSSNGTGTSTSSSPSPSQTNHHETIKAIAGGVVGGFIAVVALIIAATCYRHRRLKELEETAQLSVGSRNVHGSAISPMASDDERHRLMYPSQSSHDCLHRALSRQHLDAQTPTVSGPAPFMQLSSSTPSDPPVLPSHPPQTIRFGQPLPYPSVEHRDQIRQDRQRELNHRLEAVTSQMRSLKSSYVQDQQRLQQMQRRVQDTNGYGYPWNTPSNLDGPNPPVVRLVANGMPDPIAGRLGAPAPTPEMTPNTGEPMVNSAVLSDMRQQMQIMMDQIQYLRAQQNSPYTQGLTDEPPPGYVDVNIVHSYHGRRGG